jgi:hypothetical protein
MAEWSRYTDILRHIRDDFCTTPSDRSVYQHVHNTDCKLDFFSLTTYIAELEERIEDLEKEPRT